MLPLGRGRIYDLIHKFSVSLCMGTALLGMIALALQYQHVKSGKSKNEIQLKSIGEENLQSIVTPDENLQRV